MFQIIHAWWADAWSSRPLTPASTSLPAVVRGGKPGALWTQTCRSWAPGCMQRNVKGCGPCGA
eukprot:10268791-Lingulodinium_polyedra.AAC.1